MRDQYMLLGQAFMLVYSITSRPSMDGLDAFYQQIVRVQGSSKVPMVLCGNKADLAEERAIPYADGTAKAASLDIPFFETSAKTKQNVTEAFQDLVRVLLLHEAASPKAAGKKRRGGGCALL
jgi:GTPase KRas protein